MYFELQFKLANEATFGYVHVSIVAKYASGHTISLLYAPYTLYIYYICYAII